MSTPELAFPYDVIRSNGHKFRKYAGCGKKVNISIEFRFITLVVIGVSARNSKGWKTLVAVVLQQI